MDEQTRERRVRELLRDHLLPSAEPRRAWGGHGTGMPCAVCEEPITGAEVELEVEYGPPDAASLYRFHYGCFVTWERIRQAHGAP